MPPTFRDLAPFLTPYTSPADWAQVHARSIAGLTDRRDSLLRNEAQREATRSAAEQARKSREETERYHTGLLSNAKAEQEERKRDKRAVIMSKLTEIAATGDEAKLMAFMPEARAYGVGVEPEAPTPVAPMPMAQPTPLQDPTTAPGGAFSAPGPSATLEGGHLSPPAFGALAPPPPAAPPPSKRWRVTMDGEHAGTLDFDEIAKANRQQNAGALETYLNQSDPRDRAAMTMGYETALAVPGLNPLHSVELMSKLSAEQADRDVRRRGQDFLQARTADARVAREAKDSAAATRQQSAQDRLQAQYGSRLAGEQVTRFKMDDKVYGAQKWREALELLDSSDGNSAMTAGVIYNVAKGNDPSGIVTNRDYDVAPGTLGLADQFQNWISRKGTGDEGAKIKSNLRALILKNVELNTAAQRKHYEQLRRLRDQHSSTPAVWDAINAQIRAIYGGENWYRVAEFEDPEIQRRARTGGELPSAAPMATPGNADGGTLPTTQGLPNVPPAKSVNRTPPSQRGLPPAPTPASPRNPTRQAAIEDVIGGILEGPDGEEDQ